MSHVAQAGKSQKGRWAGMDAGNDVSDDQVREGGRQAGREGVDVVVQEEGGQKVLAARVAVPTAHSLGCTLGTWTLRR